MEITTTAAEVVTTAAEEIIAASEFQFEPMNFVNNLHYMGTGMLGIFIVIGIIIVATVLINKLASRKTKKDQ